MADTPNTFDQFIGAITATHEEIKANALDADSPLNQLMDRLLGGSVITPKRNDDDTTAANAKHPVAMSAIEIEQFQRDASRFESLVVALSEILSEVEVELRAVESDPTFKNDPSVQRSIAQYKALKEQCLKTILIMKDSFRPRLLRAHQRCKALHEKRQGDGGSDFDAKAPKGSAPPPRRGKAAATAAAAQASHATKNNGLGGTRSRGSSQYGDRVDAAKQQQQQANGEEETSEGVRIALLQQEKISNRVQLTLSNGQVLNGVNVTDAMLAEEAALEMENLAKQTREVREMMSEIDVQVSQQQERLANAETNADASLDHATDARQQLTTAAKLKTVGATITGALFGGLIGGPAGLVAGAKSAPVIVGCVAGGMFVGGAVTKGVNGATAARNAQVDDRYEQELDSRKR